MVQPDPITHKANRFAFTLRNDRWWVYPSLVLLGFTAFIIYSTIVAWQGKYYWWNGGSVGFGGYLSPFYSPPLFIKEMQESGTPPVEHAWFGAWPSWLFDYSWLPASPSWLILIFPLAFRLTCYYYRKAYYRSFAGTPPACAVGAVPQSPFKGETGLLVFQNLHRYTVYFAIIVLFILAYDGVLSWFNNGRIGFGTGTLVLTLNPILLGFYTFGCHSWRHIVGGHADCYSCSGIAKIKYRAWERVTMLNQRHELWAWISMIWVGFSDFYVRMVSMGIWTDYNTWGV